MQNFASLFFFARFTKVNSSCRMCMHGTRNCEIILRIKYAQICKHESHRFSPIKLLTNFAKICKLWFLAKFTKLFVSAELRNNRTKTCRFIEKIYTIKTHSFWAFFSNFEKFEAISLWNLRKVVTQYFCATRFSGACTIYMHGLTFYIHATFTTVSSSKKFFKCFFSFIPILFY